MKQKEPLNARHTAHFSCHTALDAVSPDICDDAGGLRVKPAMTGTINKTSTRGCNPLLLSEPQITQNSNPKKSA